MSRTTRYLAAVAAVAATGLAVGGASTASNTVPGSDAGFGSGTISGATVNSATYTLDGTRATITAVTLTFPSAMTGFNVSVGFNAGAHTTCTPSTGTTVSCPGLTQSTSAATALDVAVWK